MMNKTATKWWRWLLLEEEKETKLDTNPSELTAATRTDSSAPDPICFSHSDSDTVEHCTQSGTLHNAHMFPLQWHCDSAQRTVTSSMFLSQWHCTVYSDTVVHIAQSSPIICFSHSNIVTVHTCTEEHCTNAGIVGNSSLLHTVDTLENARTVLSCI